MITPDGWVDWAVRYQPSPANRNTNAGVNPVRGIFLHSAEGYKDVLLRLSTRGPHSWHFSNMFDGTLYQHYPLTARCWHATEANQSYVGMENEGVGDWRKGRPDPTLTEPQFHTAVQVIRELSEWKGWRPTRTGDTTQTLWEHNEVTRLGGSGSECPSHRIPWSRILDALQPPPPPPPLPPYVVWIKQGFSDGSIWHLDVLPPPDRR